MASSPPEKLSIEPARQEHAAEWRKLRAILWPDCPPERHALEVEQLLASQGVVALALIDDLVVGFAEVSIRHDHVEGTTSAPVPYLEGWFVDENWRARGIGRALLNFVEGWARAQGFAELASDAELENALSIHLHKQLGFRDVGRTVHFVKSL